MTSRCISLLALLPLALTAQVLRDAVPLKNWPAPLYWQPSQAETEAAAGADSAFRPLAATPVGSLVFVAMTPCRVVDTRASQGFPSPFGPPTLTPGTTLSYPIQSSTLCSIPATAQAYSFNVTLVPNPTGNSVGYLKIFPTAAPPNTPPNAVTIDDVQGSIINNAAVVPAGITNGSVSAIASGNTDLVLDINGYYAPSTGVTLALGSASAPSLSFSGDAGTGIYSSGANTLNFATGGTNQMTVDANGDVDIPGSIRKNGTLFLNNLGSNNTGVGISALAANSGLGQNTAIGTQALASNTTGTNNTASGFQALLSNTTANYNTALGSGALQYNTSDHNTAAGYGALYNNTTGDNNTASGFGALEENTTGRFNTATGADALSGQSTNTTGSFNTADGGLALEGDTTGSNNTASGAWALYENTTGSGNTAVGYQALYLNVSGSGNTALGAGTSGGAGYNITGSNNIDIGNDGISNPSESGVIRIGESPNQVAFYVAGVNGVSVAAGVPVLINSSGQLGTVLSSRRYKEDIQDMGEASSDLLRLRPVTFRYKKPYEDGSKPLDYGLIAEEVAEVYPDLVVRGKDGQIETVQYQKLTPMLLNEVQKQNQHAQQQDETIRLLEEQNRQLETRLSEQNQQFETRLAALETLLSSKVPTTAATGQQENR
jgi:endosialidase-like protein